jgi:hypothetical protein
MQALSDMYSRELISISKLIHSKRRRLRRISRERSNSPGPREMMEAIVYAAGQ